MNIAGTIRQFQHFIALAETGSFTRAARRSHLSQPAFSRSIAMLESDLDVALVDRVGRKPQLTAIGRSVLKHARQVVLEAEELARHVSLYTEGTSGHFRLGAGSTPSALLLGPLLAYVAHHHPTLRLSAFVGPLDEQVAALKADRLDAIVVEMRAVVPTSELHIDHIADLRTGLLVRPDHPLRSRGRAQPLLAELRRYPIACTAVSEEMARALVSMQGPDAHPDESITLLSNNVASLLEAACQSDAIFMGTIAAGAPLVKSGLLVELHTGTLKLSSRFALVRIAGRTVAPFYEHLHRFVTEHLHD